MTLKEFKSIHKKDSADKKLDVIYDTANLWASARRNVFEASLRENQKDIKFYIDTEEHMRQRLIWLITEVKKEITRLEGFEERILEQGEE